MLAAALAVLLGGWLIARGVVPHLSLPPLLGGVLLLAGGLALAAVLLGVMYDYGWTIERRGVTQERRGLIRREPIFHPRASIAEVRLDIHAEMETRVWLKLSSGQSILVYWDAWEQAILVAARISALYDVPRRMVLIATPMTRLPQQSAVLNGTDGKLFGYSSLASRPATWILDKTCGVLACEQGNRVIKYPLNEIVNFRILDESCGVWHEGGKSGDYYLYQSRLVMVLKDRRQVFITLIESRESTPARYSQAQTDAEWIITFFGEMIGHVPVDYLLQGLS